MTIDLGSQSVRMAVIDRHGNFLAYSRKAMKPFHSSRPGYAEQDARDYWQTLIEASHSLFAENKDLASSISAISLTSQRNTVVFSDAEGNALRPAIVGMDRRRADLEDWPSFPLSWILKLSGYHHTVHHAMRESEANWLKQNEPEIWQKFDKFLYLSGYILHKLTGKFHDARASIVGYVPFDYKKQEWCKESMLQWKMISLRQDQLPQLFSAGEKIGMLSQKAAEDLGLSSASIPVIAAGADKACELLGSGCMSESKAAVSLGTSSTLMVFSKKYREIFPQVPSYPAIPPFSFHTEFMIYRGFWLISWFIQQFCHEEKIEAEKEGISVEEYMDARIAQLPAANLGLILHPFWTPVAELPGPEAKGALLGFGGVHDKFSMYRAIIEGVMYALREGLDKTEKKFGRQAESVRISGGGARSDLVAQICADVLGRPVEAVQTTETSLLGAAMCSFVGLGAYNDFDEASDAMHRVSRRFEPRPEQYSIYDRMYRKVFRKIYRRLKPLYLDIQRITSYPEQL